MNIYKLYDDLSSEPYSKLYGKPKGFLRCGYCDNYYEPTPCSSGDAYHVCSKCGEVAFPYEEE